MLAAPPKPSHAIDLEERVVPPLPALVDDCIICLDDKKATLRLACCGAGVHARCAARWLRESSQCPHCRRDMDEPMDPFDETLAEEEESATPAATSPRARHQHQHHHRHAQSSGDTPGDHWDFGASVGSGSEATRAFSPQGSFAGWLAGNGGNPAAIAAAAAAAQEAIERSAEDFRRRLMSAVFGGGGRRDHRDHRSDQRYLGNGRGSHNSLSEFGPEGGSLASSYAGSFGFAASPLDEDFLDDFEGPRPEISSLPPGYRPTRGPVLLPVE